MMEKGKYHSSRRESMTTIFDIEVIKQAQKNLADKGTGKASVKDVLIVMSGHFNDEMDALRSDIGGLRTDFQGFRSDFRTDIKSIHDVIQSISTKVGTKILIGVLSLCISIIGSLIVAILIWRP